ncbi:hypothetical protein L1049_023615 [Liquidambar formosana]|uniref:Protein kinase domain-containing protein n=1 Tax=Liquidambar formosana TaxID=63359 RepID=A0AAP0RTR9_LIQFO
MHDPGDSFDDFDGLAGGVVAGISVAGAFGVLLFAAIYVGFFRRKKAMEASKHLSGSTLDKATESTGLASGASPGLKGTRIDNSVKFSYEELAKATDNFSSANKIGEGGFGSVYYAELRSELCGHILLTTSPLKAAIKKMGMQASREFLAELKVLTRVHHLNLGISNINYRICGAFWMKERKAMAIYAQYGDVSPKMDVYAFGVILYELISAKKAIFKTNDSIAESRGLVALFEDVPDHREYLCKLVDPRLGDDYPFDSVRKMAQLAKACTQDNPHLRPSMRSVVVALMILSSSTEDWDVGSLFENQALVNLMSGS